MTEQMKSRIQGIWIGFGLSILFPLIALGEENRPQEVLNALLTEALKGNALLASSEASISSAEHAANAADRLPDPSLSATYSPVAIETRGGPQRVRVSASQSFPFFGERGLRRDVAGSEAIRLGHRRDGTAAGILFDIKQMFWEIYRIDQALMIAAEESGLLGNILGAVEALYQTGKGDQANLFQIQLMQTSIQNRTIGLRGSRASAVEELIAIVGKPVTVPPLSPVDLPLVLIDSSLVLQETIRINPILAARKEQIRKARLELALIRKDYYPDFALAAGWAEVGKSDLPGDFNGRDSWSVGAMLKVPLYRGDIREKEASKEEALRAAEELYEDARLHITAGVLSALNQIVSLEESIELFNTALIPLAESTFESAMAGYATGGLEFADLIMAEKSLLEVKLGYHESVAQYRQSVSVLEHQVGYRTPESVFPLRADR